MTILNPSQNKSLTKFFIKVFVVVLIGGLFYIYQYNQVADKRYTLENMEQRIAELEVENAELKNELYTMTDPSTLEDAAEERGLVLDQSPNYLNVGQWVSDSSF